MEQNPPTMAKKLLKIVKVIYFMLRKGIAKGKLLHDLNTMMKRGKIAGKAAIHNLMMFHHHHHHHSAAAAATFPAASQREYEFSCSGDSPAFHLPFHLSRRRRSPPPTPQQFDRAVMAAALEIFHSASASPALPGFGPSPMVRQLRITDSPFPLRDSEEDCRVVDAAAEEFITRFYRDLEKQNSVAYLGYS